VRLLLDTHALLWAATDDERLSPAAREAVADPANELLFSAVSAFEIAVKVALGKLDLPEAPATFIGVRVAAFGLQLLPVTVEHAIEAGALPPIHGDPWDRLLIAQARIEDVPILTADSIISRYEVMTIW
jgi:PIN domain nuclease of toxin-antitoxin system